MSTTASSRQIKAVCFDFMGTCLDWHSTVVENLPTELSTDFRSKFALEWRQTYFDSNTARLQKGQPPEDFDLTLRRTLDSLLAQQPEAAHALTDEKRKEAIIRAWHLQKAWDDVAESITTLKEKHGLEVFVHANGTTRLQLDLVQSSGLKFDMLFSSELLGHLKPGPEAYQKALRLIKLAPEQCVMVAAHADDLHGAKNVGMKTVYIRRWTDDIREDQDKLKGEFDAYLDGMKGLDDVISNFG